MDKVEAKLLYQHFTTVVPQHTDVFFSLSQPVAGKSDCKAIGSCVHLIYKTRKLTITCSHVAKEDCIYFTNPKGLSSPHVPVGQHPLVSNITLLKRSEQYDLALFETVSLPMDGHGKTRFDLSKSVDVTKDLLSSPKLHGLASCIYGVWANQTSGFIYPDGLAYMEVITYSGIGPILEVSSNLIVTDHSEKLNLRECEPQLERIKSIQPTGGYRDISGCSGSGLWIMKDEPILAGILLRPRPASPDKHLIEFTPIWHVRQLIEEALANGLNRTVDPRGGSTSGLARPEIKG